MPHQERADYDDGRRFGKEAAIGDLIFGSDSYCTHLRY
jgi:hypothetical protein